MAFGINFTLSTTVRIRNLNDFTYNKFLEKLCYLIFWPKLLEMFAEEKKNSFFVYFFYSNAT